MEPSSASQPLSAWLFRWRSLLPLGAVSLLAFGAASGRASADTLEIRIAVVVGCLLAALGLAVRLYTVGFAPEGTSGRHRRQHASQLNTFGIYSAVRHPLYLGNLLVWAGVSLTSGWWLGTAASLLLGAILFVAILRHEDRFLRDSFGAVWEEWAAATPALVPRLSLWRTARRPWDLLKAVHSEYSTLHSIVLLVTLFSMLRRWSWEGLPPSTTQWLVVGVNFAVYATLRRLRRRSREARLPRATHRNAGR